MRKGLILGTLFLAGFTVLGILDHYYHNETLEEANQEQAAALERARSILDAGLKERIQAVEDLRAFIAAHGEVPDRKHFDRYAGLSLSSHRNLRALQYADTKNIIRYISPLEGNEEAINLDLMTRPAAPFVTKSRQERVTTVSDPVLTVQGSRSIVIRSPIYLGERYLGLAQGVVDIEPLLQDVSEALAPRYAVTLKDGQGKTFWQSGKSTGPALTAQYPHWLLTVSRNAGQEAPPDHTRQVLWFLGIALLLALLFIINQFVSRMDILSKAVKSKTAELTASEARFRTVIERASEGILIADAHTGVFNYANPTICTFLGYSRQEMLRLAVSDIHPPEALPHIMADFTSVAEKSKSFTPAAPCLRKDGTIVYADINATPMEIDGRDCNVGFFRDVTVSLKLREEKDAVKAQLCQAQKLEAIGILAGGIAHDFNNILAIIVGYAELAKEDAPAGTELAEDLDSVLAAAARASELVKQILAFSRQAQVERLPLRLPPLIKESLKMLRASIPTTISIIEEIEADTGTIMADPTQVHQILINLGTNAYHAMEEKGGTLSVALRKTRISDTDQKLSIQLAAGEYIELVVADTGTGIGPDILEKIFDPFFTTKEKDKGTGMGLSIIHGIISDYGGAITVDSQLGRGSAFHVYFPVIADQAGRHTQNAETPPTGRERILFVDDEEMLAHMGGDMLTRLGYTVTVEQNSINALETFSSSPHDFDLVITDQTMPEMTGYELSEKMLRVRPDIPIILCTGYSNLVDEDSAKAVGIREFALKPLTRDKIAVLIRRVLDSSPVSSTPQEKNEYNTGR